MSLYSPKGPCRRKVHPLALKGLPHLDFGTYVSTVAVLGLFGQ